MAQAGPARRGPIPIALRIPIETALQERIDAAGAGLAVKQFRAVVPGLTSPNAAVFRTNRRAVIGGFVSAFFGPLQAKASEAGVAEPELDKGLLVTEHTDAQGPGVTLMLDVRYARALEPVLESLLDPAGGVDAPSGNGIPSLRWVPVSAGATAAEARWLRLTNLPPGLPADLQLAVAKRCLGVEVEEVIGTVRTYAYSVPVVQGGTVLVRVSPTAQLPSADPVFAVQLGKRKDRVVVQPEDIGLYQLQAARGPRVRFMRHPAGGAAGGGVVSGVAGRVLGGGGSGSGSGAGGPVHAGAAGGSVRAGAGAGAAGAGTSSAAGTWSQKTNGRVVAVTGDVDAAAVHSLVQSIFAKVTGRAASGAVGGGGVPAAAAANPFAVLQDEGADAAMGEEVAMDQTPTALDAAAAAAAAAAQRAAPKRSRAAAQAAAAAEAALLDQAIKDCEAAKVAAASAAAAAAEAATAAAATKAAAAPAAVLPATAASAPVTAAPTAAAAGVGDAGGEVGGHALALLASAGGGGGSGGGGAVGSGLEVRGGLGRRGEEDAEPGVHAKLQCQGRRGGTGDFMDVRSAAPPGGMQ